MIPTALFGPGHRALAVAQACGISPSKSWRICVWGRPISVWATTLVQRNVSSQQSSSSRDLIRERFASRLCPPVFSRVWLVLRGWSSVEEFAEGIAGGEEAVAIAGDVNHPFSLIMAYRCLHLYLRKGDLDKAICFLERCRELGQAWNIRSSNSGRLVPGLCLRPIGRLATACRFSSG